MENIVATVILALNKQWDHSSSVTKNGILHFDGRGVSIFRRSTDYCIKP